MNIFHLNVVLLGTLLTLLVVVTSFPSAHKHIKHISKRHKSSGLPYHHKSKLRRRSHVHKGSLKHRQAAYMEEWTTESSYEDVTEWPNPPQELCTCNLDDEPVCATNGITYLHPCLLVCDDAELDHYGECGDNSPDCDCSEEDTPDPVCGTNGETYQYSCIAHCENIEIDHSGECETSGESGSSSSSSSSESGSGSGESGEEKDKKKDKKKEKDDDKDEKSKKDKDKDKSDEDKDDKKKGKDKDDNDDDDKGKKGKDKDDEDDDKKKDKDKKKD